MIKLDYNTKLIVGDIIKLGNSSYWEITKICHHECLAWCLTYTDKYYQTPATYLMVGFAGGTIVNR